MKPDLAQMEQAILAGLSVPESDPCWTAVLLALDYEQGNVYEAVIAPDLTNESRQFNAGRAAALEDFKNFLHAKFEQAHSDRLKEK